MVEVIKVLDNNFCTNSQSKKASSDPQRRRHFTARSPQPSGWAKLKKIIVACIRALCCCMTPDTTSRRKVFPQKHEDTPRMTRSTRHVSGTFSYLLYLVFFYCCFAYTQFRIRFLKCSELYLVMSRWCVMWMLIQLNKSIILSYSRSVEPENHPTP